jgi:hypothetical protein
MKFVYGHHRKIDRVAAVTDNAFLKIAPKIAEHFAHPEMACSRHQQPWNA